MYRAVLFALPFLVALAGPADACQQRTGIAHGETLNAIAARCGVNVEALRQLNPGLRHDNVRAGTVIAVPPKPLPSPRQRIGAGYVQPQPPLVPRGGGGIAVQAPVVRPVAPPDPRPPIHRPKLFHHDPGLQMLQSF